MRSLSNLIVSLAAVFASQYAHATSYYYTAEQVHAYALYYNYPGEDPFGPYHTNVAQAFDRGQLLVTLDNDALDWGAYGRGGLLTIDGILLSSGLDPRCSGPGVQCPGYFGNAAALHIEKQFGLDWSYAVDETTGAFMIDGGGAQNSYLEFMQDDATPLRFDFTGNHVPIRNYGDYNAPSLSLGGAFTYTYGTWTDAQWWPGTEFSLSMDLRYLSNSLSVPEPTAIFLFFLGAPLLLLRHRR